MTLCDFLLGGVCIPYRLLHDPSRGPAKSFANVFPLISTTTAGGPLQHGDCRERGAESRLGQTLRTGTADRAPQGPPKTGGLRPPDRQEAFGKSAARDPDASCSAPLPLKHHTVETVAIQNVAKFRHALSKVSCSKTLANDRGSTKCCGCVGRVAPARGPAIAPKVADESHQPAALRTSSMLQSSNKPCPKRLAQRRLPMTAEARCVADALDE